MLESSAHFVFRSLHDNAEHLALVKGNIEALDSEGSQIPVPTRVQAEHRIRNLFSTSSFPSHRRIEQALQAINKHQRGVFVYIRHPRSGILKQQVNAINVSEDGVQKQTTQLKEYGIGAQILSQIGAKRIILLANSSLKNNWDRCFSN